MLKSEKVRLLSLSLLIKLGYNEVEPTFQRVIRNGSSVKLKLLALKGLSKLGSSSSLTLLCSIAGDDSESVPHRQEALTTLSKLKLIGGIPTIVGVLRNCSETRLRARAALALGAFGSEAPLGPLLEAATGSVSIEVRRAAFQALASLKRDDLSQLFCEALENESDIDIRLSAVRGLKFSRTEESIRTLIQIVASFSKYPLNLRRVAVESIASSEPKVLEFLNSIATNPSEDLEVRVSALSVIGTVNVRAAVSFILAVARDAKQPDELRKVAFRALQNVQLTPLINAIAFSTVTDAKTHPALKLEAARTFARGNAQAARIAMSDLLHQASVAKEVRYGAIELLCTLSDEGVISEVVPYLESGTLQERCWAGRLLGNHRSSLAKDALYRALSDDLPPIVRESILEVMRPDRDPAIMSLFRRFMLSADYFVRFRASKLMANLNDKEGFERVAGYVSDEFLHREALEALIACEDELGALEAVKAISYSSSPERGFIAEALEEILKVPHQLQGLVYKLTRLLDREGQPRTKEIIYSFLEALTTWREGIPLKLPSA